jgi:ubiquinol-cytochrome c reductase cytochrome c subunit
MFAWIVGLGGLVGVGIWLTSHTARTKKKVDAA